MKKLNLPIIKISSKPKQLSMDEYLEFVYMNLNYTINKKHYKSRKKELAVKVSFSLK